MKKAAITAGERERLFLQKTMQSLPEASSMARGTVNSRMVEAREWIAVIVGSAIWSQMDWQSMTRRALEESLWLAEDRFSDWGRS